MAMANCVPVLSDSKHKRLCFCNILLATALFSVVFFIGITFTETNSTERISRWETLIASMHTTPLNKCKDECRPPGSEALPKGIVKLTSDLEMKPLLGPPKKKRNPRNPMKLLAMPVGIKQKESVNQIVEKFLPSDFTIMLLHYDGVVDEWRDLQWSDDVLHVSAMNQTKWWFAKRFLHPDIVAEYEYIFLWDEDLGVENFHPERYLSIVKEEGLEVSQPALDRKSQLHHYITERDSRTKVHRRTNRTIGTKRCYENITEPPCAGFVEMMAPVFTRAAWRCTWYMIQNDLILGWGLDYNLGYCAQGDRTKNVGVVDSEYIFHAGVTTLGGSDKRRAPNETNFRSEVRRKSANEMGAFKRRWQKAVREDECWINPYPNSTR